MRKLAGVVAWAERGVAVPVPSEEALSNARARLGPGPLRLLFEKVAGFVAPAGARGAWWRGLRLVSLDGTTLDAQDEQANWGRFGGPSAKTADGTRLRGAFPQVRLLALAECGTRARPSRRTVATYIRPRAGLELTVVLSLVTLAGARKRHPQPGRTNG